MKNNTKTIKKTNIQKNHLENIKFEKKPSKTAETHQKQPKH